LGESVHTIKKNAKALVFASMVIGLEASADKTKYIIIILEQNAKR
jgi:hypothetical protein